MKEIIEELTGYFTKMQDFDKDSAQDGQALHAYLISLTNIAARSNYLKAEYNRKFREEKKKAYQTLAMSSEAQARYYAPSLAKDFIDAQCSKTGFVYDLADRCSASAVHTISACITIVSDLKSERQFAQYST